MGKAADAASAGGDVFGGGASDLNAASDPFSMDPFGGGGMFDPSGGLFDPFGAGGMSGSGTGGLFNASSPGDLTAQTTSGMPTDWYNQMATNVGGQNQIGSTQQQTSPDPLPAGGTAPAAQSLNAQQVTPQTILNQANLGQTPQQMPSWAQPPAEGTNQLSALTTQPNAASAPVPYFGLGGGMPPSGAMAGDVNQMGTPTATAAANFGYPSPAQQVASDSPVSDVTGLSGGPGVSPPATAAATAPAAASAFPSPAPVSTAAAAPSPAPPAATSNAAAQVAAASPSSQTEASPDQQFQQTFGRPPDNTQQPDTSTQQQADNQSHAQNISQSLSAMGMPQAVQQLLGQIFSALAGHGNPLQVLQQLLQMLLGGAPQRGPQGQQPAGPGAFPGQVIRGRDGKTYRVLRGGGLQPVSGPGGDTETIRT